MARAVLRARVVAAVSRDRVAPAPVITPETTVEMRIKDVKRIGGSETSFDLEVRAGTSTDISIVSAFMPDNSLFEHEILSPGTCQMRGIRISTSRPMFVFTKEGAIVAAAEVDLTAGRPRIIRTTAGTVYLR